jgi:RNA polymerase sigma-70 factor (ECF subfamily)
LKVTQKNPGRILTVQNLDQSDAFLVTLVAQKDSDALMALYRRYNARVYSLIARIVNDVPAAEELLQDCFHRLWQKPQLYDSSKGSLLSWLFTVGRNLALDYKRKESRRAAYHVFHSSEDFAGVDVERLPQATALEPELAQAVQQAMQSLPEAQRVTLEMAYFEGLTHLELAEKTGQSLGTVKTRIRLGMSKLKEALRDYGKALM